MTVDQFLEKLQEEIPDMEVTRSDIEKITHRDKKRVERFEVFFRCTDGLILSIDLTTAFISDRKVEPKSLEGKIELIKKLVSEEIDKYRSKKGTVKLSELELKI